MSTARTPRDVTSTASRAKIMDGAERLMARHGYVATSIAAICAESGLPVGSVYHHFGSKLGLLRGVFRRGEERLFRTIPHRAGDTLRQQVVGHYRVNAGHLPLVRIEVGLLLQAARDPEIRELVVELETEGRRRIAGLFTAVAADAGVPEPHLLGHRIAGLTINFARGMACQGVLDPQRLRSMTDAFGELVWITIRDSCAGAVPDGERRPASTSGHGRVVAAIPPVGPGRDLDSRERILDGAARMMATMGYGATSVADICADARLPVGSLYHHFGNKLGLLRAIMERGLARFDAQLRPVDSYRGPARHRLHDYYQGAAAAVSDNLPYFRVALALRMHDLDDPEVRGLSDVWRQRADDPTGWALAEVAAQAGVLDPAALGRRLAGVSSLLTDGSTCGLDPTGEHLGSDFTDISDLLWSAISRSV